MDESLSKGIALLAIGRPDRLPRQIGRRFLNGVVSSVRQTRLWYVGNGKVRGFAPLSLCLLAWLCQGCVPLKFTTSPGATGKIVDAATHSPVAGAEIIISRSTYPPETCEKAFANARPPMVMSREAGQFSVPLERRLDFYFAPVDLFPRFGLLVVRCQGYETTCVPFWSHSVAELGEIDVKPVR
jgi:hypothetical protein